MTRLCYAPPTKNPRGIDRVDLAFARHFIFEWPYGSSFLIPTPWGPRCFNSSIATKIISWNEARWNEDVDNSIDPTYKKLQAVLSGQYRNDDLFILNDLTSDNFKFSFKNNVFSVGYKIYDLLKNIGMHSGVSAVKNIPSNSIYLNTGQVGLARRDLLIWLQKRPDIRPVFMIHDVIPIDTPEYVSLNGTKYHKIMIENTAEFAKGLIVSTETSQKSILQRINSISKKKLDVFKSSLPVDNRFLLNHDVEIIPSEIPFFVFCGNIEPRKNLSFLLNVWKYLINNFEHNIPKLLIIGHPNSLSTETIHIIKHSEILRNHILQISGLSTRSLRNVISSAHGLLMPSFAEGFGLPIIEALSMGTPVIASDIPAHREAGGHFASYVSPIDGLGWAREIESLLINQKKIRAFLRDNYRPYNWIDYFMKLDEFIKEL